MRTIFVGTALSLLLAAAPAIAQDAAASRLSLEPYVGAIHDSYDISPDGEKAALHLGLRVGYEVGARTRLLADVGYARSSDVSDPAGLGDYFVYDNTWALTTVGAEYDVVSGRNSIALGLRLGAAWRRNDLSGQVGQPAPEQDRYSGGGFTAIPAAVPSLTLRREILPRAALTLTVQDHLLDVLDGPLDHSPAFALGVTLR